MPFAAHSSVDTYVRLGLTILAISVLSGLSGCSDSESTPASEQGGTNGEIIDGNENSGTQARYRLTFNATWSEASHPLNFPANPHFSGLVGAVHNEQIRFWEPAQIATPGIQRMAETGSKAVLLDEVQAAIDSGLALSQINGGGIGTSPGTTSIEFDVNRSYPQISVTSMLAPSPDWFIGLHNYSLIEDGEFIESATIGLSLYDSGSDNGLRYTSANDAAAPLAPISTVSSEPQDAPFINGNPSVGSFTLERLPAE